MNPNDSLTIQKLDIKITKKERKKVSLSLLFRDEEAVDQFMFLRLVMVVFSGIAVHLMVTLMI